jgi:hypothetical protein
MVRYRVRCSRPAWILEHDILEDGSVVTEVIDPAPASSCTTEGVDLDFGEDAGVEQHTFTFTFAAPRTWPASSSEPYSAP